LSGLGRSGWVRWLDDKNRAGMSFTNLGNNIEMTKS